MDTQILAWVSSIVLAIGAVGHFVQVYGPKARKAAKIAQEALTVINLILDATEDKVISKEEVEKIISECQHLQEAIKGGK